MIAFHGKQETKDFYLARVRAHRAADQLRQSLGYWVKGSDGEFRGCAVGCTLHSDDHAAYEEELGIPRILARLEDGIFESLPADRAMTWPEEFLASVVPGADLSQVWAEFAVWMLVDPDWGVLRFAKSERSRAAIEKVAGMFKLQLLGETINAKDWRAAAYAAADAADAAYAAYAAFAAAYVAADAAVAAAVAAADAAAVAAADAADAADDARKEMRVAQADKLLALMAAAPVVETVMA